VCDVSLSRPPRGGEGDDMIGKLTITVTKTADGRYDYVQIASPAAMPVNIVLVADLIVVEDHRNTTTKKKR